MNKLWIALALLALPPGAWMVLGSRAAEPSLSTRRNPASPAFHGQESSLPPGLLFRSQKGKVYRYGYQREILLKGFSEQVPPISFKGEMYLRVLDGPAHQFSALVSQRMSGQPPNDVVVKVMSEEAGKKIRILSRDLTTEDERQQEAIIKDLLAQLFFSSHVDTVGEYEAHFELLPAEAGFLRGKKNKISYLGEGLKPEISSSEHLLKWNIALALPDEVSGRESTRMGDDKLGFSSEASYRLRFLGVATSPAPPPSLLASLDREGNLVLDAHAELSPVYGGPGWPELAKKLEEIENLASSERLKLFGDLVKLLAARGVTPGDLLGLLRAKDVLKQGAASPVFQTVVGALATDGSPAAQAALREIYRDPASPFSGKGTVLAAFTTTQATSDTETQKFLTDTMADKTVPDLAYGAAFALGSALEKAGNSPQAMDSIRQILAAWDEAVRRGDRAEQLALLDAMGNSGREEFYRAVAVAAETSDSEIKAKAVFALRFLVQEPALRLLATALSDADVRVRGAAVTAMKLAPWSETFRPAVTACSSGEADAHIRSSCLELQVTANRLAKN